MLRLVVFCIIAAVASALAEQPTPSDPYLPTYTSAKEVLQLSRAESAAGFPVELRAVVTLNLPGEKKIFVQDASGGIYVKTTAPSDASQGDLVLVKGRTDVGKFAPIVIDASVSRIRPSVLPVPRRVALNEFRFPTFECLFVESEGTVRSVYQVKNFWQVNLFHRGYRMAAYVYSSSSAGIPYPGDVVRVRGVASAIFNNKGQSLGTRLLVQDFAQSRVIQASTHLDIKLPLTPIGDLLTYAATPSPQEHVRVTGTVTCSRPDGTVCIQNGADGMQIRTGVRQTLRLGEMIEVVGFPAFDSYSPTLEDVSIRRRGAAAAIKPLLISAEDARLGQFDGRLVEMTGTVVLQDTRWRWNGLPDRLGITLREGAHVFTAELSDPPAKLGNRLRIGSRVRVSGVCHVTSGPSGGANSTFSLRMRTPSDLEVIEAASWWTREHAMRAVMGLGVAVALGLCWLALLRRKVNRQTSIIRSQLQLETALAERFRDLFENSTDLVFTVDVYGHFTAMNHATKQTLGCSGLETGGLSLHSFVGPEDIPLLNDILGILIGGESSVLRQMSVLSWRGQTHILEMNCRLRHGIGRPASIDIIARDVTKQKREETAREQARIAAESASRAKSEFLANMSHEIRTPMSGILGMTELTLATNLAEDQKTNLEVVKTSAEALLTIINDILDFSKIEAGRMDLEREPFRISQVIGGCLDLVALPAAQKGIELVFDIDPKLPSEWIGDAARLRQVLMNLVGNAVKFTESGQIALRIEHFQQDNGVCKARFCIEDTGIGIPPEQQSRIFEMFCQADGSTSRKYGGTGLGLAIAARLVALMGGRLMLESRPGKGSTFSFTLDVTSDVASRAETPLIMSEPRRPIASGALVTAVEGTTRVQSVLALEAVSRDADEPAAAWQHTSSQRTVLLAEDNKVNQMLAVRTLEKGGYRVLVANNGAEAVRVAKTTDIDLILMDIQMPEMDGFQATARIRDSRRANGMNTLPVIAMTAHALKGDRERCISAGMTDYISKPVRPADLMEIVSRYAAAQEAESTSTVS